MSVTHAHQGIIALAAARPYATLDDIFALAESRGEAPLIVVCDELSDPHNLGAIIRSAECAGAHGVVIPKRRSAGLTPVVAKASAGAVEYLPVARVPNIPSALKELQTRGVWVYGTAADGGQALFDADFQGPAASSSATRAPAWAAWCARPATSWCESPCAGASLLSTPPPLRQFCCTKRYGSGSKFMGPFGPTRRSQSA